MTTRLAGCVILDEKGRLLLLHRLSPDYDHWEIPGGKVESDEDTQAAAIRELHEELGVIVNTKRNLGSSEFVDKGREFRYHWWLAEIESGELEIKEPMYFDSFDFWSIERLSSGNISISKGLETLLMALKTNKITL
jgi:8-oxo-dGTP pyrophosphatase MutT (NUDIX family)